MRAARIVETSPETGHEAGLPTPDVVVGEAVSVRVASEHDAAAASPVHALHAQLAEALAPRQPVRLDPTRVAIFVVALVYTAGAWWGLARLGSMLVRHWIAR